MTNRDAEEPFLRTYESNGGFFMSKVNLYELPVEGASVVSLCGGNLTSDNESCVGIAEIPGGAGYVLADTKPEGSDLAGLRFTAEELDTFAVGWLARRNLTA